MLLSPFFLLLSAVISYSNCFNKTDLSDYMIVGDNMTELSNTIPEYSENTENIDTEDKEETDIEEEAPIDSGRRKGRIFNFLV